MVLTIVEQRGFGPFKKISRTDWKNETFEDGIRGTIIAPLQGRERRGLLFKHIWLGYENENTVEVRGGFRGRREPDSVYVTGNNISRETTAHTASYRLTRHGMRYSGPFTKTWIEWSN